MIISPLSPFIFYATDTSAVNQYNTRSVMPIPANMPKRVFVVGETYTIFIETDTAPTLYSDLWSNIVITESLPNWWRIDIMFYEQGRCKNLVLNNIFVCYEFEALTSLPKNTRNPFVKIEYSNFENDFGNVFVTGGVKEYFHLWLQVNNIKDIISSDKETFTDDYSKSSTQRATSNDGISITALVDGQTSKMLNKVFSCKFCRINGIGYSTSEDFSSDQAVDQNGMYNVSMDLYRTNEEYVLDTLEGNYGLDAPLAFGLL